MSDAGETRCRGSPPLRTDWPAPSRCLGCASRAAALQLDPAFSAAPRIQPQEMFMASSTRFELLGRLCGYFCDECQTPLAGATIRLYQPAPGGNTTAMAVAHPKETFAILTDEQVAEKKPRLLAEAVIGDDGSFRVA